MQQNNLMRWIEAADEREFVLVRRMATPAAVRPILPKRPRSETADRRSAACCRRCCELAPLR